MTMTSEHPVLLLKAHLVTHGWYSKLSTVNLANQGAF